VIQQSSSRSPRIPACRAIRRGEHRAERALKLRVAGMAAARDLAPARLNALNDVIDHRRRHLRRF